MIAHDHPQLLRSVNLVLTDLHEFGDDLDRGSVADYRHDVFAERARSLSIYLASALRLATSDEYPPAFAVLRAGLEHHLTDLLLFLGNRYITQHTGVKKSAYEQLRKAQANSAPGTEDILRITFSDGTMRITRSGLHPTDASGTRRRQTISIYYFLLQEYDPFVGAPQEQSHLAKGFTLVEDRIANAEEQRQTYALLSWQKLKMNLLENRLCTTETLRRFEVHYRFLSAFVHPVPAGYDLVYGRNRPTNAPKYDHYVSELVLLNVAKIAAAELKALKRMSSRTPRVTINRWPTMEGHIKSADRDAAHFWYPGVDAPHAFDRVEEANSRGRRRNASKRPAPEDLKPTQVRYYRNPLQRLIKMHQSFDELTGFSYVSPWPRSDARVR